MALLRSNATSITVSDGTQLPGNATWLYFKGNGHTAGRNAEYDHVPVHRYFFIPTVENGIDSLPWSGGFSLCWQLIPVRQAAYYTTFFYAASQGTDFYDLSNTHGYLGCHPYPHSAFGDASGDDFRLHKWEVSVDAGDFTSSQITYGQRHTQAFRCNILDPSSGRSSLRFYTQVSSAVPGDQPAINHEHAGAYANAPPHPYKAMVFGNAPWWEAHQHERLSGYVRRIKIFAGELSDEDLLLESMSDELVTTAGAASIWWAKISPQNPDDLISDFVSSGGVRRVAQWRDQHRAEIVADADIASHHAFQSASTIGNLQHMERGT